MYKGVGLLGKKNTEIIIKKQRRIAADLIRADLKPQFFFGKKLVSLVVEHKSGEGY